MKFLCVTCDEPMKMRQAGPDDGGSITAVFGCPTCDHQIAMLTNPWETEVVQSLGVKIGPGEKESGCPFSGVLQEMEAEASPAGVAWTAAALERLERIPEMVRPMARQGIETWARSNGCPLVTEEVLDQAKGQFGM